MSIHSRLPASLQPYYRALRGHADPALQLARRLARIPHRIRAAKKPAFRQCPLWEMPSGSGTFHPVFPEEIYSVAPPKYFGIIRDTTAKMRRVPAQWRATLTNATVYNPSWAITSNGILWQQEEVTELPYNAVCYSQHFHMQGSKVWLQDHYTALPEVTEAAVIAHRTGFNYLHALFEILPKIMMLDAFDPARRIPAIIDDSLAPSILATIHDFLGPRPQIVVPKGHQLTVQTLHCFSTPAYMPDDAHFNLRGATLSPHFTRALAERLRVTPAMRIPLLFASRLNYQKQHTVHVRNVINHALLDAAMEANGALTYFAEQHSWYDQRDTFAAADRIVIVAGAAMANLIYCRPGTKVLVLARNDTANYGFFSAMMDGLGLESAWLLGQATEANIHASYHIDPAHLEKSLNWLMRDAAVFDGEIPVD